MLKQKVINEILREMDKVTKCKLLCKQSESRRHIYGIEGVKTVSAKYLYSEKENEEIIEVFGNNCCNNANLITLLWNNAFEMISEIEKLRYENSFLREKLVKKEK